MHSKLLAAAVLTPATLALSALPATAATPTDSGIVHAAAVSGSTAAGASPIHRVRSSSVACSGTLAYTATLTYQGKVAGQLYIFTRTADGGQAIACFQHAGLTKGKRLLTAVAIAAAKTATATKPAAKVVASGNFISWAGPAAVGGIKGKYIQAEGAVKIGKQSVVIDSPVLLVK